jgi:protein tyrosine phosphatase (PTP) superfamily phosphohydrolase (DUF442 family)
VPVPLLLGLALSLQVQAQAQAPAPPAIPGAVEVRPGLFVAGATTPEMLGALKARGVTAVLNARLDGEADSAADRKFLDEQGIRFLQCPVGREPDARTLDAFRAAFRALPRSPGAVLLHCSSGNRVAGALYAAWVLDEGMEPGAALALAKRAGLRNPATEAAVKAYVAAQAQP